MKKRLGRKRKNKQGQLFGMSFQFIFSIIMIAVVLFVAFFAIRHFMLVAEQGKILSFKATFENKVEKLWGDSYGINRTYEFDLSTKIKWVCFANTTADYNVPLEVTNDMSIKGGYPGDFSDSYYEGYNMFLLPLGTAEKYHTQSNFRITCKGKNCLEFTNAECIPVKDGKVIIRFRIGGENSCPVGKVCVSAP